MVKKCPGGKIRSQGKGKGLGLGKKKGPKGVPNKNIKSKGKLGKLGKLKTLRRGK